VPQRHRRRGCAATGTHVAVETSRVIAITDTPARRSHLMTEAAAAAGRTDAGRYVAVCGAVVFAASLTTPEATCCASCASLRALWVQAAPDRGSTISRNGGDDRWKLTARMC
jgi:hypothetical protein